MEDDYTRLWQKTMDKIQQELGEESFSFWFKMEYLGAEQKETLIVIRAAVQNIFQRDELIRRYQSFIENKFLETGNTPVKLLFEIKPSVISSKPKTELSSGIETKQPIIKKDFDRQTSNINITEQKHTPKGKHPQLRDDYTFSCYVIGENNRFAANAAMAIAKNPGITYNPFLVYGGVGLGKTHLMQAIGNFVHSNSSSKIIYITSENFLNEFVDAISQGRMTNENKMQPFKNKFRYVDVLLIDDIQFFQNKTGIQDELFFTFEALYNANKQLVFTCDRPVSELKQIQDRLRSRFERGLNLNLEPPNYETRCAILKSKIEARGITIPDDVINLVGRNISTNIRDLEAALTKLAAYLELTGKSITLEIAQQQLKDMMAAPKQTNLSIETIQKVIADKYGISLNDLKGSKRTKNIVLPRQLAMYISREITDYSTTEIGQQFGKDHTTVMHSYQKIEERLKTDPSLDPTVKELINLIKDFCIKS
ncbi:chromosomal replication initiator protein DnaA [Breznakiellaceae bacterium SP9]